VLYMPRYICDHSDVGHIANLLLIYMEAAKNLEGKKLKSVSPKNIPSTNIEATKELGRKNSP